MGLRRVLSSLDLFDVMAGSLVVVILTVLDLVTHGAWILLSVGIPLVVLASLLKNGRRSR